MATKSHIIQTVASVFVFLLALGNSIGIQENEEFGVDPEQEVETSNQQQQRDHQQQDDVGGSEFETGFDINEKFLQSMLQREAETDVNRRAAADKSTSKEKDEIQALKAELAEQKKQHEDQLNSVLQQIDALARQDVKTLKLIGSQGQEAGIKIGVQSASAKAEVVITSGGVHYVRWGRNTCPGTAFELYRGYTAGTYYSSNKGGVNTLCLHDDPQWGATSDTSSSVNLIYGAEYYFSSTPFSTHYNGGSSLYHQDAPCIVCHTPIRTNQIMIPARRSCPAGWTLEYTGYIVSDAAGSYSRSDFICLDESPEVRVAGQGTQTGLWLSNVRIACGSLACPKYVGGRPLACVVCTK